MHACAWPLARECFHVEGAQLFRKGDMGIKGDALAGAYSIEDGVERALRDHGGIQ